MLAAIKKTDTDRDDRPVDVRVLIDKIQSDLRISTKQLDSVHEDSNESETQPPPAYSEIDVAQQAEAPSSSTNLRTSPAAGRLPYPVVLPQRRPGNSQRGFVRAYAPALGQCGIDQDAFLDFLDTFQKSCESSKWLSAMNVAADGIGIIPNPVALGASVAVRSAMSVQHRYK